MAGTLYLVPTPIGNLGDISRRIADTLGEVDFIAAEDTRVTLKLLNHLGLKSPCSPITATTPGRGAEAVLSRLLAGRAAHWSPTRALRRFPTPARSWWPSAPREGWMWWPSPAPAPWSPPWRYPACPPAGSPSRASWP